jgi:circadian clock protein KaiC
MDRIPSGRTSLDAVLGGGLPANSIALLAGAPGSGKTILAQQFAFTNGTAERPALIVTTVSEPLDKVVRFGQGLEFFDPSAVGTRVIYESVADVLVGSGLHAVMDRIVVLLTTLRPSLLVIDSFHALGAFATDLELRRFLAELTQRLAATAVTSIWLVERSDNVLDAPEAAAADAIIRLSAVRTGQRTLRFLEVLKVRGSGFLSGTHAYRLGPAGIEVFARLADPVDASAPLGTSPERISLGSDQLDAMIDGGVWPGTSTLIVGPSGAGKTILGLDFLSRAAAAGHVGVLATLQESRTQMNRALWGEGRAAFEARIAFHHRSPVDIYIDEWVAEVFELIDRLGAEVLVIDSLSDLRLASPDDKRFEEFVYSLSQRLSRRHVTTLMTLETAPVFGMAQIAGSSLSNLADNLILLAYVAADGEVQRVIHVLKSRASGHDPAIRSLEISGTGLSIGDPVTLPV